MNGPFHAAQDLIPSAAPAEYEIFAPEPLLLPGESREQYNALRSRTTASSIKPLVTYVGEKTALNFRNKKTARRRSLKLDTGLYLAWRADQFNRQSRNMAAPNNAAATIPLITKIADGCQQSMQVVTISMAQTAN